MPQVQIDRAGTPTYVSGMLRPLLAVVLLVATVTGGVQYAATSIVYTDHNGHPLDYPGDRVPCTRCREPLVKNVRGYHFRCQRCGVEFDCRLGDDGRFRYEPDLRGRTSD
jgi:hypothetical protein